MGKAISMLIMKDRISSLELKYIVEELQVLISAKVDKIYQPEKKEIDLRLHIPGKGKKILRVSIPKLVYLSDNKREYPESPYGFCMFLRKRLSNARIREIKQHGSERIIKILFETRENKFWFIIELFSKGNVILCSEDFSVIAPLETQIWKDRQVRPKKEYVFPSKGVDIFRLSYEEVKKAISSGNKPLVKTLAVELGLGGTFAEEICLDSGVNKEKEHLDEEEMKKISLSLNSLVNRKRSPVIIEKDNSIVEILPFDLALFGDEYKKRKFDSFNEAIDHTFSTAIKEAALSGQEKVSDTAKKHMKIIEIQTKQVKSLNEKIIENKQKGELIYENFGFFKELFEKVKDYRNKKSSWEEIRNRLKENSKVIELDTKNRRLTVSLD